jgi:GH43 family beta-xylosidase
MQKDRSEGWIAYHAMEVPEMPLDHDNRTTRVERFDWDENGNPVFPRPTRVGITLSSPSGEQQ